MIRNRTTLALLLGCVLAACATTGAGGGKGNVPHLALEDVDGGQRYLSDYVGRKVVVMTFWATWCMPCRQELAVLQSMYDKHRGRGLEVLAISVDGSETIARVRPFVRQRGFTFPVLYDKDSRAVALYNPKRQAPYLHIFDRSGQIVYSHGTFQPSHAPALRKKILEALGGGQGEGDRKREEERPRRGRRATIR